jgi:DNA-binding MarR family transcriptional regulator
MLELDTTAPTRRELAEQLLQLLPALKRTFQASIPAELREELGQVTPHQLEAVGLLFQLRAQEGGATMHEVARMQGCALSTATALIDRLIKQGLAARTTGVDDRRVVKITPTDRARRLLETFIESRRRIALSALEPLGDEELDTLVRLVRKVASSSHDPCAPWQIHRTAEETADG